MGRIAAVRDEQMDKVESKRSPLMVVNSLDVSISLILIYTNTKKLSLQSTELGEGSFHYQTTVTHKR